MILGLVGKKQSGKSSLTNFLIKEFGFVEYSWAFPLKEICKNLFDLTEEQCYGTNKDKETIIPEWGMSARQILQVVGTDMFRKTFDENFWVKVGLKNIQKLNKAGYNIVVSDCRFPNELATIKDLGGKAIKIVRIGQISDDDHASETSLDSYEDWDFVFEAVTGDLDGLYSQAAVELAPLIAKE